jgi:predicted transcriptional regulator
MPGIKEDLINIASNLPNDASYSDAEHKLYVRMKISKGKATAEEGRLVSHEEVKNRFHL